MVQAWARIAHDLPCGGEQTVRGYYHFAAGWLQSASTIGFTVVPLINCAGSELSRVMATVWWQTARLFTVLPGWGLVRVSCTAIESPRS